MVWVKTLCMCSFGRKTFWIVLRDCIRVVALELLPQCHCRHCLQQRLSEWRADRRRACYG